jgi:hypothetical protein
VTRPKKAKKTTSKSESPLTISLHITFPRKAAWMASGFLTGSLTTEAIIRVLSSIHGG